MPGAALSGFDAATFAVSGATAYLLANGQGTAKPVLLAGPVTGAARWRPVPLPVPCGAEGSGALAAAGRWLFLGCGSEPGAGNQRKTAYVSRDGGHTWRQVASPPDGGYLGGASMTAGGTIFLIRRADGRLHLPRPRPQLAPEPEPGRRRTAGPTLASPWSGSTVADTGSAWPVRKRAWLAAKQVWLTRNAGRTWTPVTVH